MKCPKCGYLGFDAGPRCRNCSYDFALLEAGEDGALPLDLDHGFSMAEPTTEESADASWLQAIDRGITATEAGAVEAGEGVARSGLDATDVVPVAARSVFDAGDLDRLLSRAESALVSGSDAGERVVVDMLEVRSPETPAPSLEALDRHAAPVRVPVRTPPRRPALDEDLPLVQLQRPRAPIAVRKTPMSPKLRAVAQPKPMEPELDFLDEPLSAEGPDRRALPEWTEVSPAADSPAGRRLAALFVDALLFGGIDLAVLYLTLRIVGLQMHELQILPVWPLVVFLGLIKVAYVAVFTAMGGQTIGKMAMHIRVVSADNRALSGGAALRRTLASLVSVVTAGLGYLPGLVGRDRRAIHDRLAGSRVITLGAA